MAGAKYTFGGASLVSHVEASDSSISVLVLGRSVVRKRRGVRGAPGLHERDVGFLDGVLLLNRGCGASTLCVTQMQSRVRRWIGGRERV